MLAPTETATKTVPVQRIRKSANHSTTLDKSGCERTLSNYLAIWFWMGWMLFYAAFFLSIPYLYFYNQIVLFILAGVILLSAIYTIDREKQPKWGYALGTWAMKNASEFFKMKIVLEDADAVSTSGPAIFAMEPHDVLPLSIFSFNDCLGAVKNHKCLGCVTSACFYVPIMRHVYTWVNAHSIDKKSLEKMLDKRISPIICPGGVQEVTLMDSEDECVLYLSKRLGFVKLAMQKGVPIIPVFSFGLRQTFSFWAPKSRWLLRMGRMLGFLPMMFFGMWGLPLGPPKPCQYTNLVGSPIVVPRDANPSEELLREYHAKYVEALKVIFETHKQAYGMGHVTLRIA